MKHAGPASLHQLSLLLDQLRAIGCLREPKVGIFYLGASAFLHFHEDPSGLFADVKLDGLAFSRFSVGDSEAQDKLLELVAGCLTMQRHVDGPQAVHESIGLAQSTLALHSELGRCRQNSPINPMSTYVAFLRAINVTGRFLKMSALAEAFHHVGQADARTFINSGNVIFSASKQTAQTLQRSLEQQLEPLMGFRSEVFLRSVDEVKAISAFANDLKARVSEEGDINVCFLQAPLSAAQRAEFDQLKTDIDDFELGEREVYWLCQTKQSHSKFSNAVLERKLKARSTLRRASMLAGLVNEL